MTYSGDNVNLLDLALNKWLQIWVTNVKTYREVRRLVVQKDARRKRGEKRRKQQQQQQQMGHRSGMKSEASISMGRVMKNVNRSVSPVRLRKEVEERRGSGSTGHVLEEPSMESSEGLSGVNGHQQASMDPISSSTTKMSVYYIPQ